ncbi:hypothetical protein EYF80_065790 [Liparis tanakae]|uniref:Uncharacterized protein n=1 Tax=Liparis tanakae TaxID=230148 RepID=A0A4Z2E5M5_9TELE|nr:hypothetical protein EYF80_065790 [Liparis tanakae]
MPLCFLPLRLQGDSLAELSVLSTRPKDTAGAPLRALESRGLEAYGPSGGAGVQRAGAGVQRAGGLRSLWRRWSPEGRFTVPLDRVISHGGRAAEQQKHHAELREFRLMSIFKPAGRSRSSEAAHPLTSTAVCSKAGSVSAASAPPAPRAWLLLSSGEVHLVLESSLHHKRPVPPELERSLQ